MSDADYNINTDSIFLFISTSNTNVPLLITSTSFRMLQTGLPNKRTETNILRKGLLLLLAIIASSFAQKRPSILT
jgi:hypothetical protein